MADLIQPVIGFRSWAMEDGLLRSSGAGEAIWDPDVTVAECNGFDKLNPPRAERLEVTQFGSAEPQYFEPPEPPEPHPAPQAECACGLYAHHEPRIVSPRGSWPFVAGDDHYVSGAIAAWGRVEVHESGFRAEKARVVALALDDACLRDTDRRKQIEHLANVYGCRAVPSYLLEEEARQHGIPVPQELYPEKPESLEEGSWAGTMQAIQRAMYAPAPRFQLGWHHVGHTSGGGGVYISSVDELEPPSRWQRFKRWCSRTFREWLDMPWWQAWAMFYAALMVPFVVVYWLVRLAGVLV